MSDEREKAIHKLILETENDPDNIALILIGSSATGDAKEYSDIDLDLVVTDEKFKRISATKGYFFGTWDPDMYYGIEVDGKVVDVGFLEDAVDRGNDAVRYSFQKAKVLFSKNDKITELVKRIPVYPDDEHFERMKKLYGYVKHFRYIGEDAFNRNNFFHAYHCVMQIVFFAGRTILAHNRKLYPCHKRLLSEVEKCEKVPASFVQKSNALLINMTREGLVEYYEFVADYFKDIEYTDKERIGYILEDEWAWRSGKLPISEI